MLVLAGLTAKAQPAESANVCGNQSFTVCVSEPNSRSIDSQLRGRRACKSFNCAHVNGNTLSRDNADKGIHSTSAASSPTFNRPVTSGNSVGSEIPWGQISTFDCCGGV